MGILGVKHSDRVSIVSSDHTCTKIGDTIKTEALITNDSAVTLFLLTADCLPVTLYDPEHKVVALAHLGWKPTGLNLLPKLLQQMHEAFSTNPAATYVWIGPSISKHSYVQQEVAQINDPAWQPYITPAKCGGHHIDLQTYNIDQLLHMGVSNKKISLSKIDTATDLRYFSHYRAIHDKEREGRFATIVSLPPES